MPARRTALPGASPPSLQTSRMGGRGAEITITRSCGNAPWQGRGIRTQDDGVGMLRPHKPAVAPALRDRAASEAGRLSVLAALGGAVVDAGRRIAGDGLVATVGTIGRAGERRVGEG